jgi:hypothetical protein
VIEDSSELLIVFSPGEALPPSQRKSLFSLDLYLSWMSPHYPPAERQEVQRTW